jgi:hypothetical protein
MLLFENFNFMSKERYNQIIYEVYNNYVKSFETQSLVEQHSFDTDPKNKITK